jgi:hypothetical protein
MENDQVAVNIKRILNDHRLQKIKKQLQQRITNYSVKKISANKVFKQPVLTKDIKKDTINKPRLISTIDKA